MKSIVVEPKGVKPLASVIFLHGLGGNGQDFEPIALQLMPVLPLRWILPNAEAIPRTINDGNDKLDDYRSAKALKRARKNDVYIPPIHMEMPACWYDFTDLSRSDGADFLSAGHTRDYVHELIALEHKRDESIPLLLGGFSLGGVITLFSGYNSPVPLKGMIALSAYLLAKEGESGLPADFDPAKAPPLFMGHGKLDYVISPEQADSSRIRLQEVGVNVEWHTYEMPHCIIQQELNDLVFWLMRLLGVELWGSK